MHALILLSGTLFAPAPVVKAVVFPDRAQVTRAREVDCGAERVVRLDGLTPAADPASVRAQLSIGDVEGLRVEAVAEEGAFSAEAKALDEEERKIDDELALLDDERQRDQAALAAAERLARAAQAEIGREMAQPRPNPRAWTAALDEAVKARLAAAEREEAAAPRRRALAARKAELAERRARQKAALARRSYRAEVIVGCPAGKKARLEVTYLVGGAAWRPSYVARADERGKVELTTWATVEQRTGEDWQGASLILSTALPGDDATPPEVRPLYVGAAERGKVKKTIVGRAEARSDVEGGEAAAGRSSGRVAARDEGLSVQLAVPGASDVAGDGTPARLEVGKVVLAGDAQLRTAPKLAPFAYRVVSLGNGGAMPLLPGPIDLYRGGAFVARHQLRRVPAGGRFELTFGLEESVKVKRTVLAEVERDKGLLGPTRRRRYAYRFEVANHLSRAEEIELADHTPVSELDDVKVGIDDKTTAGWSRDGDGIVRWRLRLAPGERRTIELRYYVEVPAAYDTSGG